MNLPSPLQKLELSLFSDNNIQLYVKREDLIHPEIGGNKWRKLKYNLLQARADNQLTILTFGGAYSNHIYAVAAAGKLFGFKTIGIIRGEAHADLNPTLGFAVQQGMQLHYVDRQSFREKYESRHMYDYQHRFGSFYLIPEGGTNEFAIIGVAEMIGELVSQLPTQLSGQLPDQLPKIDFITTACGTGGTLAGLVSGVTQHNLNTTCIGFPVLKNAHWMRDEVNALLSKESGINTREKLELMLNYHFGGYAKTRPELFEFMRQFNEMFDIRLEQVYTAKMFYGLFDLIKQGYFPKGSSIVAIHSGGLQGLDPKIRNQS